MNPEEILAEAKNPDGSRRFYPPFGHPALRRLMRYKEQTEILRDKLERQGLPTTACDEILAYVARQIAAFERTEDMAKYEYLLREMSPEAASLARGVLFTDAETGEVIHPSDIKPLE